MHRSQRGRGVNNCAAYPVDAECRISLIALAPRVGETNNESVLITTWVWGWGGGAGCVWGGEPGGGGGGKAGGGGGGECRRACLITFCPTEANAGFEQTD